MQFRNLWILKATIILFMYELVKSHPQCLDFKPPFESNNLEFCSQYSEFGCCTKHQEQVIFERYEFVKSQLSEKVLQTCEPYLRDLLCQTCSPYAAHIYSAEQTMRASSFPGLCYDYCSEFYTKCKSIVKYITSDSEILGTLVSKESFCLVVQLIDVDYCFPDLLKNEHLNFNISIEQITKDGCMCVEHFAWDLRNPVLLRHSGDGSGRLFVAEQRGVMYIYYKNGTREQRAFLDIKDRVLYSGYIGDERGFLGFAFHPNFDVNRRFYVYYSARLGYRKECIRISEFKASSKNPNRVSRKTERILLQVEQPFSNHNGGELLFGDDGYLYIFIGDGGSGGDPYGNSQNKSVMLGKVLRIDVDDREDGKEYAIPPSNPFLNENETLPEIYAYGIRNIWRCDKDEGDRLTGDNKGRIICGDVGQNAYEEIDLLVKGGNYGWNGREGYQCFHPAVCGKVVPEELPIFSYPHSVGKSVTGGHVYRGCESPNLNGLYIYGDFTNGRLFYLYQFNESQIWLNKEINMCGDDVCFNGLHGYYSPYILSFGEDENGEIYILSSSRVSAMVPAGNVYKLVDPFRRGNPELCEPQVTYNDTDVAYNISGEWIHSSGDNYDEFGSAECLDPSGFTCTFTGLETSEESGSTPEVSDTSEEAEEDFMTRTKVTSSNSDLYVENDNDSFIRLKENSTSDAIDGGEKELSSSITKESTETIKLASITGSNSTYGHDSKSSTLITDNNVILPTLSFSNDYTTTLQSKNYFAPSLTIHNNLNTSAFFDNSVGLNVASGNELDSSSGDDSEDDLETGSSSGNELDSSSGDDSEDDLETGSSSGNELDSSSAGDSEDDLKAGSSSRNDENQSILSKEQQQFSSAFKYSLQSSLIMQSYADSNSFSTASYIHLESHSSILEPYTGDNAIQTLTPSRLEFQLTESTSRYRFVSVTDSSPTSVINTHHTLTLSTKLPNPTLVSIDSSMIQQSITIDRMNVEYSSIINTGIGTTSKVDVENQVESLETNTSPSGLGSENNVESSSTLEEDLESSSDSEDDLESSSNLGDDLESSSDSENDFESSSSSGDQQKSTSSPSSNIKLESDNRNVKSTENILKYHLLSSRNIAASNSIHGDIILSGSMSENSLETLTDLTLTPSLSTQSLHTYRFVSVTYSNPTSVINSHHTLTVSTKLPHLILVSIDSSMIQQSITIDRMNVEYSSIINTGIGTTSKVDVGNQVESLGTNTSPSGLGSDNNVESSSILEEDLESSSGTENDLESSSGTENDLESSSGSGYQPKFNSISTDNLKLESDNRDQILIESVSKSNIGSAAHSLYSSSISENGVGSNSLHGDFVLSSSMPEKYPVTRTDASSSLLIKSPSIFRFVSKTTVPPSPVQHKYQTSTQNTNNYLSKILISNQSISAVNISLHTSSVISSYNSMTTKIDAEPRSELESRSEIKENTKSSSDHEYDQESSSDNKDLESSSDSEYDLESSSDNKDLESSSDTEKDMELNSGSGYQQKPISTNKENMVSISPVLYRFNLESLTLDTFKSDNRYKIESSFTASLSESYSQSHSLSTQAQHHSGYGFQSNSDSNSIYDNYFHKTKRVSTHSLVTQSQYIASVTTVDSTSDMNSDHTLTLSTKLPHPTTVSNNYFIDSSIMKQSITPSTLGSKNNGDTHSSSDLGGESSSDIEGVDLESSSDKENVQESSADSDDLELRSGSGDDTEDDRELGSDSEKDDLESSSDTEKNDIESRSSSGDDTEEDLESSPSSGDQQKSTSSSSSNINLESHNRNIKSTENILKFHLLSSRNIAASNSVHGDIILSGSMSENSPETLTDLTSTPSLSTQSLPTYRFVSVTDSSPTSVINSHHTLTLSTKLPDPSLVSNNYIIDSSMIQQSITIDRMNVEHSSIINTKVDVGNQVESLETNTSYSGLGSENNVESSSILEEDLESSSNSGDDMESNSDSDSDLESSSDTKDDLESTSDIEDHLESSSSSEDDLESKFDPEHDLESGSDSDGNLESSSDTKNDLESSSDTEDDLELTSDSKDDLESSSDSKDDLESSSDSKDDLESSSDKKDDLESSSDTEKDLESRFDTDDLESSSDREDDLESSSVTEDDLETSSDSENDLESSSDTEDDLESSSSSGDNLELGSATIKYSIPRAMSLNGKKPVSSPEWDVTTTSSMIDHKTNTNSLAGVSVSASYPELDLILTPVSVDKLIPNSKPGHDFSFDYSSEKSESLGDNILINTVSERFEYNSKYSCSLNSKEVNSPETKLIPSRLSLLSPSIYRFVPVTTLHSASVRNSDHTLTLSTRLLHPTTVSNNYFINSSIMKQSITPSTLGSKNNGNTHSSSGFGGESSSDIEGDDLESGYDTENAQESSADSKKDDLELRSGSGDDTEDDLELGSDSEKDDLESSSDTEKNDIESRIGSGDDTDDDLDLKSSSRDDTGDDLESNSGSGDEQKSIYSSSSNINLESNSRNIKSTENILKYHLLSSRNIAASNSVHGDNILSGSMSENSPETLTDLTSTPSLSTQSLPTYRFVSVTDSSPTSVINSHRTLTLSTKLPHPTLVSNNYIINSSMIQKSITIDTMNVEYSSIINTGIGTTSKVDFGNQVESLETNTSPSGLGSENNVESSSILEEDLESSSNSGDDMESSSDSDSDLKSSSDTKDDLETTSYIEDHLESISNSEDDLESSSDTEDDLESSSSSGDNLELGSATIKYSIPRAMSLNGKKPVSSPEWDVTTTSSMIDHKTNTNSLAGVSVSASYPELDLILTPVSVDKLIPNSKPGHDFSFDYSSEKSESLGDNILINTVSERFEYNSKYSCSLNSKEVNSPETKLIPSRLSLLSPSIYRFVPVTTLHSASVRNSDHTLTLSTRLLHPTTVSNNYFINSSIMKQSITPSTLGSKNNGDTHSSSGFGGESSSDIEGDDLESGYDTENAQESSADSKKDNLELRSGSGDDTEDDLELGSDSEKDDLESSSDTEKNDIESRIGSGDDTDDDLDLKSSSRDDTGDDLESNSGSGDEQKSIYSSSSNINLESNSRNIKSTENILKYHLLSSRNIAASNSVHGDIILSGSMSENSPETLTDLTSTPSLSTQSLPTYRFVSVTDSSPTSVINSHHTLTLSTKLPDPSLVSNNYIIDSSMIQQSITIDRMNVEHSSIINTKVDVGNQVESLETNTSYSGLGSENNVESSSILEEDLESSSNSGDDMESNSDSDSDLESSSDTKDDLESTSDIEDHLESSSSSEDDLESKFDPEHDLESGSDSDGNLESSSDTKNDLESSSDTEDDLELTSDSKDDLESSSDSKDDLESSSDKKDDLESSSDTEKDLESRFDTDDLESSSDREDDLESSSVTEDDLETSSDSENDLESSSDTEDDLESSSSSGDNLELGSATIKYSIPRAMSLNGKKPVSSPEWDVTTTSSMIDHKTNTNSLAGVSVSASYPELDLILTPVSVDKLIPNSKPGHDFSFDYSSEKSESLGDNILINTVSERFEYNSKYSCSLNSKEVNSPETKLIPSRLSLLSPSIYRFVPVTTLHSASVRNSDHTLTLSTRLLHPTTVSNNYFINSSIMKQSITPSTLGSKNNGNTHSSSGFGGESSSDIEGDDLESGYDTENAQESSADSKKDDLELRSGSGDDTEDDLELGSDSEKDDLESSSDTEKNDIESRIGSGDDTDDDLDLKSSSRDDTGDDLESNSGSGDEQKSIYSSSSNINLESNSRNIKSTENILKYHLLSSRNIAASNSVHGDNILSGSMSENSPETLTDLTSTPSLSTQSLPTYRFVSVTDSSPTSVINSHRTLTLSTKLPHPTLVSNNYIINSSMIQKSITIDTMNVEYSSIINTGIGTTSKVDFGNQVESLETNTSPSGLGSENNVESSSILEEDLESSSNSGDDMESSSDSDSDLKSSSDTKDDLETTSYIEDHLESISNSEDDLESRFDPEDELESSSDSDSDLESISDTKNDLESSSDTEDDLELTSDTKDDLESSSHSEDDLESSSNTKDDLESSSETEEHLESGSDTKDDLKSSSDTKDDLKSSSDKKDHLESSSGTKDDLESRFDTDDLESSSDREDDLDSSSDLGNDLESSSVTEDDLKTNSDSEDDLESSSDTKDDPESRFDPEDDLESSFDTEDDLESSCDTEEYLESSSDTEEGLESSSKTEDDLESISSSGNNLELGSATIKYSIPRAMSLNGKKPVSSPEWDVTTTSSMIDHKTNTNSLAGVSVSASYPELDLILTPVSVDKLIPNSKPGHDFSFDYSSEKSESLGDNILINTVSERFEYNSKYSSSLNSKEVNSPETKLIPSRLSLLSPSIYRFVPVTTLHSASVRNSDHTLTLSTRLLPPTTVSNNYFIDSSIMKQSITPSTLGSKNNGDTHSYSGLEGESSSDAEGDLESGSDTENVQESSVDSEKDDLELRSGSGDDTEDDLELGSDSEKDDLESSSDIQKNDIESRSGSEDDTEDDLESSSSSGDQQKSTSSSSSNINLESNNRNVKSTENILKYHLLSSRNIAASNSVHGDIILSSSMSDNSPETLTDLTSTPSLSTQSLPTYRFVSVTDSSPTSVINSYPMSTKVAHPPTVSNNSFVLPSKMKQSTTAQNPLIVSNKSMHKVYFKSKKKDPFEGYTLPSGSGEEDSVEARSATGLDVESSFFSERDMESNAERGDNLDSRNDREDNLESSSDREDDLVSSSGSGYQPKFNSISIDNLKLESDNRDQILIESVSKSNIGSAARSLYSSSISEDGVGSNSLHGDFVLSSSMPEKYPVTRTDASSSLLVKSPSIFRFVSKTTVPPSPVQHKYQTSSFSTEIFSSSAHTFVTSHFFSKVSPHNKIFSYSPKVFSHSVSLLAIPHLAPILSGSLRNSLLSNHLSTELSSLAKIPQLSTVPPDYLSTGATLNIDDNFSSTTRNNEASQLQSKEYTDVMSASGDSLDISSSSGSDLESYSGSGEGKHSSSASGEEADHNSGSGYNPYPPHKTHVSISSSRGEKTIFNSISDNSTRNSRSGNSARNFSINQNAVIISSTSKPVDVVLNINSVPAYSNRSDSGPSSSPISDEKPDSGGSSHVSSASGLTIIDDTDYSTFSENYSGSNSASGDDIDSISDSGDNLDSISGSGDDLESSSNSGDHPDSTSTSSSSVSSDRIHISISTPVNKVKYSQPDKPYKHKSKLLHIINSNHLLEKSVSNDIYIENNPYTKPNKLLKKQRKLRNKYWKHSFVKTQPIPPELPHRNLRVKFKTSILRKQQSGEETEDHIDKDLVSSDMYDY